MKTINRYKGSRLLDKIEKKNYENREKKHLSIAFSFNSI